MRENLIPCHTCGRRVKTARSVRIRLFEEDAWQRLNETAPDANRPSLSGRLQYRKACA